MDYKRTTIATYDAAAAAMAKHFQKYNNGAANQDIDEALRHISKPEAARVVEIGCGAGKEAAELVRRVSWYEGFDPSAKLLELARTNLPGVSFVKADALSYNYPDNLDAVFAFASMLHLDETDFAKTCGKIEKALKPGGVLCMTLKEADEYGSNLQEDEFGKRMFYFYNPELVGKLAGKGFKQVFESHQELGPHHKRWFVVILQKISSS